MELGLTAGYQIVDQWLLAFEHIFGDNLLPVVAVEDKLVFEEIYIGSLVSRQDHQSCLHLLLL